MINVQHSNLVSLISVRSLCVLLNINIVAVAVLSEWTEPVSFDFFFQKASEAQK